MLHAILEHGQRVGLAPKPGFKLKTVRWLLVFTPDGRFLGVHDLRGEDRKSRGRDFPMCPDLTDVELKSVIDGRRRRHFLVDQLKFVALFGARPGDQDQVTKHGYFLDMLEAGATKLPILATIAASLRQAETRHAVEVKLTEAKAKPTELATLAVAEASGDPVVVVQQEDWRDWWCSHRAELNRTLAAKKAPESRSRASEPKSTSVSCCLLTGELTQPIRNHFVIDGLKDVGGRGQDRLACFDKEAFCSYGLEQGANAAMSEQSGKEYVTALNHLIRNRSRNLAGAKVLYWYSGEVKPDDDPVRELLDGFDVGEADETDTSEKPAKKTLAADIRRHAQAESRARQLLEAIHSGERPDLGNARFYALTLSANSGRVVVRDWMEGSFEELLEAVDAWFTDLTIVSRDGKRPVNSHKFAAVLAAPLRDLKGAAAPLVATLWRCALKRQAIPFHVMAQTLHRVRLDLIQGETPRHSRFGLLKAFCNRQTRIPDMNPEVNEYETHPAYLCGRVMAILARIQQAALGDVGAGVVQRYYAAASATPALVLGRLVRNAQIAHLPKIQSKGLSRWFEQQLAEVWGKLKEAPKSVLTLEEQTLFAMGYYQQNAKRSESGREPDDEPRAAPNE